jgi:hypothetical protein
MSLTRAERAARDQRVAELTRGGYSARFIAEELNITMRTVARCRVRTGTAQPPPCYMTDTELRLAETLLDDGASYCEVARTIGRSTDALRTRFPDRSVWKQSGGAQYRQLMQTLDNIRPHSSAGVSA